MGQDGSPQDGSPQVKIEYTKSAIEKRNEIMNSFINLLDQEAAKIANLKEVTVEHYEKAEKRLCKKNTSKSSPLIYILSRLSVPCGTSFSTALGASLYLGSIGWGFGVGILIFLGIGIAGVGELLSTRFG